MNIVSNDPLNSYLPAFRLTYFSGFSEEVCLCRGLMVNIKTHNWSKCREYVNGVLCHKKKKSQICTPSPLRDHCGRRGREQAWQTALPCGASLVLHAASSAGLQGLTPEEGPELLFQNHNRFKADWANWDLYLKCEVRDFHLTC